MTYAPRTITFLGRDEDRPLKHYGIAVEPGPPRPALATATRELGRRLLDRDHVGFTIAHDAATAALAIVYRWRHDNEIHHHVYAAPLEEPAALTPVAEQGLACVWELEVIDFERRAWLEDVLQDGDLDAYLARALEEAAV